MCLLYGHHRDKYWSDNGFINLIAQRQKQKINSFRAKHNIKIKKQATKKTNLTENKEVRERLLEVQTPREVGRVCYGCSDGGTMALWFPVFTTSSLLTSKSSINFFLFFFLNLLRVTLSQNFTLWLRRQGFEFHFCRFLARDSAQLFQFLRLSFPQIKSGKLQMADAEN